MDALVAWLVEVAERQPVLTVWEDLHWADPSSLELLGLVIDQTPTTPMLSVLTYRPDFQPPWPMRSHMTPLTLNRLERPQVEAMIGELAHGKALPAEVVRHIVVKTDGVPLFVEELTKTILESGLVRADGDRYTLTGSLAEMAVPATLQDSLMARLDRLPTVREVAQLGAVLGREFAYEMLRALARMEDTALQRGLTQLVGAELLYQRGRPPRAKYVFKHALIQDAAYGSLLRSTRQTVHQQIAELLEARFPETVATEPELVARHYTEAGCHEPAVRYWWEAGRRASERSASVEAVSHLTRGLEVLAKCPDTPERARQELELHLALGGPLTTTRGYASPELAESTIRARELVDRVGSTDQRFDVFYRQWAHALVGSENRRARVLAEEFLRDAEGEGDPALVLTGHRILGVTLLILGEPADARRHLERTRALYDPERHRALAFRFAQDPESASHAFASLALWLLGAPEQAARATEAALAKARAVAHANTLAYALLFGGLTLDGFRGDPDGIEAHAGALTALAEEQGAALWLAYAALFEALIRIRRGDREDGLARFARGLDDLRATGSGLFRPLLLAWLAEAHLRHGQSEEGLRVIDEALALARATGELFWEAEMHRLKGELLLAGEGSPGVEAEACLRHALGIARRQHARALELRAAMSLGRLWQRAGKRRDARELLASVHGGFTEDLDTPELREATALLAELTWPTAG
jgi:predicted ATPase